jgi:hypothetical protein
MPTSPALGVSRPATSRSRVDLPQPDGPSRLTNEPGSICMVIGVTTGSVPNDLATSTKVISAPDALVTAADRRSP